MNRYTHTMCMAFGADGEPDRVEVDATFDYLVAGSAISDIRVLKIDGRDVTVADADLHDRIHDDLESGRFDDLLISLAGTGDLEPCPFCGSDVRVRKGVNGYGHCQTEGCHANRAQIVSLDDPKQVAAWNRRAAPAPSSLAGGDRKQFLCDVLCGVALDGNEPIGETADRILAALSPEAPAREVTAFAMNGPMTTHPTLRSANIARQDEWDQDGQITASYRGNELAGEVGEACNVIKKLERERLGILGSRATVGELADELADVLICADLIAMHYGIDLEAAVARKFNATSEKVGLQTRLATPNDGGEA